MIRISITDIDSAHDNGIVKVWWFKDGGELNEEWESREPIWNILSALEVYRLLTDQEVTIGLHKLTDNFSKVQPDSRLIPSFFDDMDKHLDSFQCSECPSNKQSDFRYDRTVANGEVWFCRNCGTDLLVNEEPNEDNY